MNNQEKFKQTFDEVHAPEGLLGKVMDMHMEKKEFKTRHLVKAALCALAVTCGVFAAGNGICYAATGESLVTKMKIVINGEETEKDVEWTKKGDAYHGEIVIPSEDGSSVTVLTVSDDIPENMDVFMEISKEEVPEEDDIVEEAVVELRIEDEETESAVTYESFEAGAAKAEVSSNSSEDMDAAE